MIITGKHIARRKFLKGLGVAIALPMLESMMPVSFAQTLTTARKSPLRMSFVYVPNGIVMKNWTPAAFGTDFELSRILQPLTPFRDQTQVITGSADHFANGLGDGGGDHARAGASFLTGAHPKHSAGSDIYVGVSADQVAAREVGHLTRLPSLEIGLDDNRTVGHCDSGYSCAYTNSISWRTPSTPMPPEANPRQLFERLFGDYDNTIDDATRARRIANRKSILDMAQEETKQLVGSLGATDKSKMDEYLTTIRDVEQRIERAENEPPIKDPGFAKPSGVPTNFVEHARLMYEMQAIAFQADITRIATMVIGREGSVRTYEHIGVPETHHPLSHHKNYEPSLEKLTLINTHHMDLFANFLQRLKSTPNGVGGNLLDDSMILYGSGISDSDRHIHENLPIVMVGGGGGTLHGGRHLEVAANTPVTNVYMAMLQRMDVHVDSVGDSTGALEI